MTHHTGTLDGSPEAGTPALRWRLWRPEVDEVRAVVALVHGIHEHSGRYAYVASQLMLRGIEVHAFDLRGHGESEGPRGQIESFDDYLDDLDRFIAHVQATATEAPLFLMGHSMGGLIAATWWASRPTDAFAGLILSSPALQLPPQNALLLTAAPVISRFLPRLAVGKLDLADLSRDPAVQAQYANDPLNTVKPVQARTGWELYQTSLRHDPTNEVFSGPIYVFHGTEDHITDPAGSRALAEHAPGDVTLKLWEGLRHETMNEPERDKVIAALADWILAHVPEAG